MDFGSLDFGTWRLVGWGLLGLGSLATVMAIAAIIVMFRDSAAASAPRKPRWDDDLDDEAADEDDAEDYEDFDEDHDDEDDEEDDHFDRDPRVDRIAAVVAARDRERDGDPASPGVRPSNPRESHAPSPDWFDYSADVDQNQDPGSVDVGHEPAASLGTGRQPVVAWQDEAPASGRIDRPTNFPWEKAATTESAPAQRPALPERQQTVRPAAAPTDTGAVASTPAPPAEPERPSVPGRQAPEQQSSLPVQQDPNSPTADWYDDPDGSGGERWWDGKGWTRHRRPRSAPNHPATGPQSAVPGPADRRPASQADQSSSRAPGWYRDPSTAGGRRFWDGTKWTDGG